MPRDCAKRERTEFWVKFRFVMQQHQQHSIWNTSITTKRRANRAIRNIFYETAQFWDQIISYYMTEVQIILSIQVARFPSSRFHTMSCHATSHHVNHVTPCHITSRHMTSIHAKSRYVASHHTSATRRRDKPFPAMLNIVSRDIWQGEIIAMYSTIATVTISSTSTLYFLFVLATPDVTK